MAWRFAFAAECGPERENAESVLENIVDSDWCPGPFYGHIEQDHEENWWAQVNFPDLKEDDYEQVRNLIYENIKGLDFRYALADIEVDIFRTYTELHEDLDRMHFDHLLISHDVWREFGIPNGFFAFGSGKMKARAQDYV